MCIMVGLLRLMGKFMASKQYKRNERFLTIAQSVSYYCCVIIPLLMCGRYGFSVKNAKEVYKRFEVANQLDMFSPRWNIAPGQLNPVITKHSPNSISRMMWGLIPFFAKDESFKYKTINARAETVANLPTYRKPFRYQRCLVPATNFYEWDKKQKPSIPYAFFVKDQPMFAFAGLYDIWKD